MSRVILGTAAVTDPKFWSALLDRFGSQAAVGVDLKDGAIAIKGWKETARSGPRTSLPLCGLGSKTVICTDISKDGMLGGANVELYQTLSQQFPWTSSPRAVCHVFPTYKSPRKPWAWYGAILLGKPCTPGPGFEDGFEGGGVDGDQADHPCLDIRTDGW